MAQTNNKKSNFENKFRDFLDVTWGYLKGLNKESFTYIALAIGLVALLLVPFLGALIIGLLVGFTFADELFDRVIGLKTFIERQEVTRGVVLGVTSLAFFIAAPGIFIGAAIAVALKKLLSAGESKSKA